MIRDLTLRTASLTATWVALWGDPSPGTVVAGALVAAGLQVVVPWPSERRLVTRVRPVALAHFVAAFLWQLVVASVEVTLVVLSRRRIAEAIVAVPMRTSSGRLAVLVANCVTLTPGTLTVECLGEPAVLYIHVLHLRGVEDVRRTVHRLEALAARAVGEPIPETRSP